MKKIQENLMNLSDDSFGDSKLFFLNNFVFDNKKDINAFFRAFIIALAYQPSSKLILLKLINEIIDCIPSPNIALFKIELMSTVFNLPGPTSSGLFLLYHLLEKSFFTQSEIIGQIRKYRFYNIKKKSNLMLCYIWFSPEIYKENFNFYSMLKEDCSKYAQIYPNDHLVSYFVKNETELIQNDFEMIKKFRKNGHNHDYLYLLLANDDITSLQYVAAQPDFNYNRKILPSFFEICPFAQNSPSLIEVAALYGSINCFKYLLLNGSSLYLLDETNASLPQYAVAGGNLEIIRICHQKKLSFNGTSQIAALFHRNDILNWLLEDEGQEIESCIKNRGTVIQNAATTNNIIIIEQCIENDVDVNDGTLNRTSLHISCELGNIESVMLLLSADNVNLNACVLCNILKSLFLYLIGF
ncbi:hypothetical protein TRFO_30524 [Tritrichomonas foetus]|uniref:Uncharacterized protein n=1 Tax=Tritrichomonas foetus TaxID=1144522 RepID=A0A1J4JTK1_9EUKA|nr:hypothetical protein TRFO_30524 [Tritrichomonas foetus]|eukprot:OHT02395.1 hypothetical protein TRFO_30524 [Tritrichomonas foetus]